MKSIQTILFVVLAVLMVHCTADPKQATAADYQIIPEPLSMVKKEGQFVLKADMTISTVSVDEKFWQVGEYLADLLNTATAYQLRMQQGTEGNIVLVFDDTITNEEGYKLTVSPQKVTLAAADSRGLFYGVQTLRQLLPEAIEQPTVQQGVSWTLPAVEIEDEPRFQYRGMMLDVGRHVYPVAFIKKYIDLIAMHKMNTFHWHLTEDQGWRIEIKKYPKLTEIGAYRDSTLVGHLSDKPAKYDGKRYGGFYTQEEVKEIVAYATSRSITVIPEIELPGHSTAALTAYPELGDTGGPYEVVKSWGVYPEIYSPKEETFEFLQNVLLEVMELFPSKYIHIGGDEAPKTRWEHSKYAQAVIKREDLKDEHELQSYFIQRIEKFLNGHGRQIIGWDEILEGGLAPNATVMSWRGEAGGIAAAKEKHNVVMTPTGFCYLDYYQSESAGEPLAIGGYLPLERVYGYEPIPKELSPEEAQYVLGSQGNVWTEYMKTEDHVEYMVFPRMTALAEVLWSPKKARNWEKFQEKLQAQYQRYDALNVNYFFHHPALESLGGETVFVTEETFKVDNPIPASKVYFTTDGSTVDTNATLYTGPVKVKETTTFKMAIINNAGKVLKEFTANFVKKPYVEAVAVAPSNIGLNAQYFEGNFKATAQLAQTKAVKTYSVADFMVDQETNKDNFGVAFNGYLKVETEGKYTFFTSSDDGSVLFIGDEKVVDNDGYHGSREKSGTLFLRKGFHPIKVLYFEGSGGNVLEVKYQGPGIEKQAMTKVLFRD